MSRKDASPDYFTAHGLDPTTPAELNASLAIAIESLGANGRGDPSVELSAGERAALEAGGVRLGVPPSRDLLAESAVKYAALLETSIDTREAAARLECPESRVRQMIARRTLYSVLHGGRRYLFAYQFGVNGGLVPNIGRINAALDPELHPLEVHGWFTEPNPDLFLGDDIDRTVSPIQWLESGGGVAPLLRLAKHYY